MCDCVCVCVTVCVGMCVCVCVCMIVGVRAPSLAVRYRMGALEERGWIAP